MCATPCPREDVKTAFIFSCLTSLRLSDIRALCPKHIKKSPDSKSEYIEIEQQKTEENVSIPRLAEAKNYFKVVEYVIQRWMPAAGIDKYITFHTSRHASGTLLITSGGETKTVNTLMGHKSVGTTAIYADVEMDCKVEAISGFSSLFD